MTLTRKLAARVESLGPRPLVQGRTGALLAFATGLLYFVAFPHGPGPLRFAWPLALVALCPLILALRGQSVARATGYGWIAGFTMTLFGFWWLLEMLQTFSGFPVVVCLLFMALLAAYQAGRMALLGWLYARAERKGWPPGVVFALAFAASELAFPLLFPWTYAATVHDVPVLIQLAELAGPIAVSLVLVAANLFFAELCRPWLEASWGPSGKPRSSPATETLGRITRTRTLFRLGGIVAGAVIYGAVRIPMVDAEVAAADKARVGIVQANMSLKGKRTRYDEGLRRHVLATRRLNREQKLDLAVWSETAVMRPVEEHLAPALLQQTVTRHLEGTPVIIGAVLFRPVDDARRYVWYNSAMLADEHGIICERCRYDKVFLLAFGEYLPFGETFPILYDWSPESGRFTPGTRLRPLPLGDREIATLICYEDIIPAFVNKVVRNGNPELLVNMTNDAWFGDTAEPWVHFALAKFRAVEQRKYLVRSTNSGVSGFVDPVGRTTKHGRTFQEEALSAEIAWMKGRTPYNQTGDALWWVLSVVVFIAGFVRGPASSSGLPSALRRHEPSAGEDPAGEDPAGEDPAGEDPAGEDPAGEDPAGEDPADDNGGYEASPEHGIDGDPKRDGSGPSAEDAEQAGDAKDAEQAGDAEDAEQAGDAKDAEQARDAKDAEQAGDAKDAEQAGDAKGRRRS